MPVVRKPRLVVLLTLIALLVAQSAAQFHVLTHVRAAGDPSLPASPQSHLCDKCGAFTPLLSAASGSTLLLPVLVLLGIVLAVPRRATVALRRANYAFRQRAPPR